MPRFELSRAMLARGAKRCVCGQSTRFPLCDGDHGGEDWSCTGAARVHTVVIATQQLRSVAERLAHHLGGLAAHRAEGAIKAERALLLTDGTDLDALRRLAASIKADHSEALAIDVPAPAITAALQIPVREVPVHEPLQLWRSLLAALEEPVSSGALRTAFLSHAVADEPRIQPVVDYLRVHFHAELFLCADSIPGGADWRASIVASLGVADVFVFLVSDASVHSTYCAFEAGYALARSIAVQVVLLDETPPPAFLAHLQAIDLPRWMRRRPWLSQDEALVEALLGVLA